MAFLMPNAKQRFFDSNGVPLVGGKLYSYKAGTTTPKATFTDYSMSAPNTNPIVLDSKGECDVWLSNDSLFKFELKDANDVLQWTVDNVGEQAINSASVFGDIYNFTIPNNQSSPLDVTSFLIDSAIYTSISFEVEILRKSNGVEYRQSGTIKFIFNSISNSFSQIPDLKGDDAGVEFGIVNQSGTIFKVQITSTNLNNTDYSGNLKFQSRGGM